MVFFIVSESLIIVIVAALVLFLNWKVARKWFRIVSFSVLAALMIWRALAVFSAINPSEEYYYNGFEHITMQSVPESAAILSKYATFPNHLGQFSMACLIRFSEIDFNEIYHSIQPESESKDIKEIIWNESLENICFNRNKSEFDIWFQREIPGEDNHHFFIGFNKKESTILYSICY